MKKPIAPRKPTEPEKELAEIRQGSCCEEVSDGDVLDLSSLQNNLRAGVPKDIPDNFIWFEIEKDTETYYYDEYITHVRIVNKYKETKPNPEYEKENKKYLKKMEKYEAAMTEYRQKLKEYNKWDKEEKAKLKAIEASKLIKMVGKLTHEEIKRALELSAKGADELNEKLKQMSDVNYDLVLD